MNHGECKKCGRTTWLNHKYFCVTCTVKDKKNREQEAAPYKEPLRWRLYYPFWKFFRWSRHLLGFHNKYCKKASLWQISTTTHAYKQIKGPHCDVTGRESKEHWKK